MKRLLSRLAVVLLIAVPFVGIGFAVPAAACSLANNDHCYGGAYENPPSNPDGVYSAIQPACALLAPSNRGATAEVWLQGYDGFIEVGFVDNHISNIPNGLPQGFQAFWADHRPNQDYFAHSIVMNPPVVNSTAYILKYTTNTYQWIFGPSNNYSGFSTSNTMSATSVMIGSEVMSNTGNRSMAFYNGMGAHYSGAWYNLTTPYVTTVAQPPQTQAWYALYYAQNAGVPC